jgi:hypothetical protein
MRMPPPCLRLFMARPPLLCHSYQSHCWSRHCAWLLAAPGLALAWSRSHMLATSCRAEIMHKHTTSTAE